jgi:hypothetical protein
MIDPNDFAAAWQDATADLTPEQRKQLAMATPEDWANGAAEAIRDPEFWQGLGAAFIDGFLRGLTADR